jgi:glycerate dehydrogenase
MPHNLVFLDTSTLAPADLDLGELRHLGALTEYDATAPADTISRCRHADVAITNKVVLDEAVFSACPDLKLVLVAATGVNCIDLEAARRHGVTVCNVAGYSTNSVVQHTFALLLNLATNVHRYTAEAAQWPDSPIFTRLDHPAFELAGKTLGIAGLGTIGQAVARTAQSLGMSVQALARSEDHASIDGIPRVSRALFFATSDVVSLHCPLTPESEHMISSETLNLMKPGSLLINTGRGPLVDEAALATALRQGAIAGAGLDVLAQEPPAADNPLLADDLLASGRLLITPHTAWIAREARQRLVDGLVANLRAFDAGSPTNRVA